MDELRRSPLHEAHEAAGADFTGFGGWEMPVEFGGISMEHVGVREVVGKFDVSHMGRIGVGGPDATELMDRLVTSDVAGLDPGEAQYAGITDEDGVLLDDTVVFDLPPGSEPGVEYLFVPNAGHDRAMLERCRSYRDEWELDATAENVTEELAMFAVQGPESSRQVGEAILGETEDTSGKPGGYRKSLQREAAPDISRFEATYEDIEGVRVLVSRTGYTGEDGFELVVPAGAAEEVWDALNCNPCGLGARDTLRIEAGFLLSGQDFHPEERPRTPYEAGIGFAVDLDGEFVGRDALERQHEAGVERTFVGLQLVDRGVPREGYAIETVDGQEIGEVTSGTMSPTLDEPIGLGYVPPEYDDPERTVRVVVRGERKRARIETLPFVE